MTTTSPGAGGEAASRLNLMDLPGELRNEIWELSVPTDRVLMISMFDYSAKPLPPPAIAWVCRESRSVALHHGRPYTFLDPADADIDPSFPEDDIGDNDSDYQTPTTTWFSPALDRVLLAVTGYRRFRGPGQSLGALALDAQHVLVQTEAFFAGAGRTLPRGAGAQLVRSGLEAFPNARSIGAVRVGFMVRDGHKAKTRARGRGPREVWGWVYDGRGGDYRPLGNCKGRDLEPRVRVVSDPAFVRALESAHARLTAPCSCWFDEGEGPGTGGGEADSSGGEVAVTGVGDSDSNSGEEPLWEHQENPMDHHLDHGLSGLWSPPWAATISLRSYGNC
ncbi:uncharacterized protein PG986_011457 [Apiospora aurea]|uniref:2EXR domain-containing protein n=1 Tax=Apiospora aurea TaxID=335848 RepID=A0ABR1Q569_9PEZI